MKVKELKALLDEFPDDMDILMKDEKMFGYRHIEEIFIKEIFWAIAIKFKEQTL